MKPLFDDERHKRASYTAPLRPLPDDQDRGVVTSAAEPLAVFGPWPEGTWVVLSATHAFRVVGRYDRPPLAGANPVFISGSPQVGAGVHDFTMPDGSQYVVMSCVTQPPPAGNELAAWAADAPQQLPDDDG